jgi:hypothetical protein
MDDGCGCRSPRALRSCGCGWPGRSRTRSSRCGQSPWWPMGDGSGWPLPPLSPSVTIWTRGVWPGWTSASSIPTHWSQDRRVYWCQVGRSGPRATCTYATSRPAARGWRGVPPSLDSGGRGGGAVTGSACDVRRRAIAAVSTKPTMRPPSRRSPLLYDSRWGPCWLATPKHITSHHVGRVQNLRLRQWRRTHLAQALRDKAERAGIIVRMVDERGTSSTCPACRQRVPEPRSRRFSCPHCQFQGHRDLVGAYNIAAKHGGGPTSTGLPVLVEHRRAGIVPARRDRRRHLHDRRRRSCLASGLSGEHACSPERRSHDARLHLGSSEDQATSPSRATVP